MKKQNITIFARKSRKYLTWATNYIRCIPIPYIYPAFGGIFLALRGSGGFGATLGVPSAPTRETAAFGGDKKIIQEKLGRPRRPKWF